MTLAEAQCTGEMISDLDGSLGFQHVLTIVNERTCFASGICAFKSSEMINCLECTPD